MRPPRPPRDPERGNSLLLALIVMSALATLGSLTVVSMQSSIQMSTNDRAQTIAMYAAESGAAVTMDFLRKNFEAGTATWSFATSWSNYCTANNIPPLVDMSAYIPSSDARPGAASNLFDRDQNAWFHIDILNNSGDEGYATGTTTCDTDGILTIRSTGHGPQGALAIIDWTVQRVGFWGSIRNDILGGAHYEPPPPPVPATLPPVAPNYWLFPPWSTSTNPPTTTFHYPPVFSTPWDSWAPKSLDSHGAGPASFTNVGVVLLAWHVEL